MSDSLFSSPIDRRTLLRGFALAGAGFALAPLTPLTRLRLGAAPYAADAWPGLTPDQVEARIGELMKEFNVPGVSVALIEDGEVAWRGGFGRLRSDKDSPVTPESIFQAASISKPIFAIGVMKLVEDGILDLDRPLQDYLDKPWLEDEPRIAEVTARMVLAHRTGLPNWRKSGERLTFRHPPGTRHTYSGEGFVYLQTVVEKVTGTPLNEWLNENVLAPLGMTSSSYIWLPEMESVGAWRHDADSKPTTPRKFRRAMTSHSLLTTAGDVAKALTFMINQPSLPGLPSPETARSMLERQTVVSRSKGTGRGLGWMLQEKPKVFLHTGSNGGGHRALSMASLETRAGIVVLTNGPGGRSLYRKLVNSITGTQPALT